LQAVKGIEDKAVADADHRPPKVVRDVLYPVDGGECCAAVFLPISNR
jgi:hypothetical protein